MNGPQSSPTVPKSGRSDRIVRWIIVGALFLGFVAALAILARSSGWRFREPTLERVDRLMEARRYDAAAREANDYLLAHRDDSIALYKLARAEAGAGRLGAAVAALRLIPEWSRLKPEALFFEGKCLMQLGRARESESAYLAVGSTDSSIAPVALMELLALYGMEERRDDFRRIFWRIYPKLGPEDRVPLLAKRMQVEFEQVKPELNAESIRKILEADPRDPEAIAGLAATFKHADDLEKSAKTYAKALAQAPENLGIRARYLAVLHQQGDTEALRAVLDDRPSGAESNGAILKYLGILQQTDAQYAEAAESLRHARDLLPDDPEIHHRLAQVDVILGNREEAAAEAAERDRLNGGLSALRTAWDVFANTLESKPENVTREQLLDLADAAEVAGLRREAQAWRTEAGRMKGVSP